MNVNTIKVEGPSSSKVGPAVEVEGPSCPMKPDF